VAGRRRRHGPGYRPIACDAHRFWWKLIHQ
jgi:hypothetical protein